jgi:hypothetical protein
VGYFCFENRYVLHLTDNIDEIEIIENELDEDITDKIYPEIKLGDNDWIQDESEEIDDYDDVDKSIFGL